MKKGKLLWMAVIAALVLVPTMSWAQATISTRGLPATEPSFFIELYAGGGGAARAGNVFGDLRPGFSNFSSDISSSMSAYFIPGLKFGYWFTPYGTYAASWYTDWMKYFGIYTDFSYQRFAFDNQTGTFTGNLGPIFNNLPIAGNQGLESNGYLVTWAFMLAARYGFMPDSEVPFGRLVPYVAAGPAIFFSGQKLSGNILITSPVVGTLGVQSEMKDNVNVGLAAETGLRYFFTKAISVEASFKYRYFVPTYNSAGTNFVGGVPFNYNFDVSPTVNLYSGQIGVAYHF